MTSAKLGRPRLRLTSDRGAGNRRVSGEPGDGMVSTASADRTHPAEAVSCGRGRDSIGRPVGASWDGLQKVVGARRAVLLQKQGRSAELAKDEARESGSVVIGLSRLGREPTRPSIHFFPACPLFTDIDCHRMDSYPSFPMARFSRPSPATTGIWTCEAIQDQRRQLVRLRHCQQDGGKWRVGHQAVCQRPTDLHAEVGYEP